MRPRRPEPAVLRAYGVYKGIANHTVDLYYLGLIESDPVASGLGGVMKGFDVNTLGTRIQGSRNDWLYEGEFAFQFGEQADLSRSAGMATAGVGRSFAKMWAKPVLWFYYDYASGDSDPTNGSFGTFNQLFPLGHKYLGYADIVGRQNINDANVVLTFAPSKRVNFLVWYHHFTLVSSRDALYNAAGAATRRDPTGRAGNDVGDEVDVLMNVILNPHADLQFSYSHFFPGDFIERTGTGGGEGTDFFYSQLVFRF
ncbi:MAG: alginate export family protein [Singulisphaera sp.]